MSKVVVLFELADMTYKQYDAMCDEMRAQGKFYNQDRPSHVSFEKDGKFCVVDVWNSPEALNKFVDSTLMPIFKKLGIDPPQPTVLPAHSWAGVTEELISA